MHNWKKIIGGFLVAGMFVLFGCGGGEGGGSVTPPQPNTIKVVPTGSGTYSIQGNSLSGVAGIQLDIAYDAASLATPTVTQGSLVAGMLFVPNPDTIPGHIIIGIVSTNPISGSGQIAAITFASITGSGGITSITVSMIDSTGAPIASTAGIQ